MDYTEKNQNNPLTDFTDCTDVKKLKKKYKRNRLLFCGPLCLIVLTGIYVLFYYQQNISAGEHATTLQDTSVSVTAQKMNALLVSSSTAAESSITAFVSENSANKMPSMENPDLPDSDPAGSGLESPDLTDSDPAGSGLASPDLTDSDPAGSGLESPDLPDSDPAGSGLESPDLPDSDPAGSDLASSDLTDSDPADSGLEGSDLTGSDLAASSLDYDPGSIQTDTYDFSNPVPLSDAVDISYFNDAVLLGDSLTEGFTYSTGIPAASYAYKAMTVRKVFTKPVIEMGGEKVTPMEALNNTEFAKIYIMFGINETGWQYSSVFIEGYQKVIDEVKRINPNAIIYVQSVLPVSAEVSATNDCIKNEKIYEYNDLIQKMAEENRIYYLNVAEAVAQSDGSLPDEAATDGIHLKKSYYDKWLAYLQTHTVTP